MDSQRLIGGAASGWLGLHVLAYAAAALPHGADMPGKVLLLSIALATLLIWASTTDLRTFTIPDLANQLLAGAGLLAVLLLRPEALLNHALTGAAALAAFYGLALAYRHWRGTDGLGLGDAKLAGALGLWLGPAQMPAMVLVAALIAIAVLLVWNLAKGGAGGTKNGVAFGPFLAFSGWVVWLYGITL